MKQFTYNKLLVALIALGFIASLIIGYQRYQVEYQNTVVDLVADYDDVVKTAAIEGVDEDELSDSSKMQALLRSQFTKRHLPDCTSAARSLPCRAARSKPMPNAVA